MPDLWRQCRLARGATQTIAWIEARGAKLGALVELKSDGFIDGIWTVAEAFHPGLEAAALQRKQANDRGAFASIRPK